MSYQMASGAAILALVFALAACGQEPADVANAVTDRAEFPPDIDSPNGIDADISANPSVNVAENKLAGSGDESVTAANGVIPAEFRGRWGMVPRDCTPGTSDNKGLMTVSVDQLQFYESRGKLTRVEESKAGVFTGEYAFMGEGQEWSSKIRFTLEADGKDLVRQESSPSETQAFRYRKCP